MNSSSPILKRAFSFAMVLLAACLFGYFHDAARIFPVIIDAQTIPDTKKQNILRGVLPKQVLMRNFAGREVPCYFPNQMTYQLKANALGKFPSMLCLMRRGEKLHFPEFEGTTIVRVECLSMDFLQEFQKNQSWTYQHCVPLSRWPFPVTGGKRLFLLILIILTGLLLPAKYAPILLASSLFAGLEWYLFPQFHPIRSVVFAAILLLTLRNWLLLKQRIQQKVRQASWLLLMLLTSLLLTRVPLFHLISGAFPAPLLLLIPYLILISLAVCFAFLTAEFFWQRIAVPENSTPGEALSCRVSYLLHQRLAIAFTAVLFLTYLYIQNPLFLNKYKFFCKYRLGHLLYSYELALMPRALAGTVFCWLSNYFSQVLLFQLLYWCSVASCLVLVVLIVRKIRDSQQIALLSLLSGLYLSLPVTWLHLINDFARLDLFLLGIGIFCLVQIWRDSPFKYATLLLIPVGTLVHELFLLFYLPAILAAACWKCDWKSKRNLGFFVACILASAITVLLFLRLKQNNPSANELIEFCSAKDQYQVAFFSGYALSIVEKDYAFHIRNLGNEMQANPCGFLFGTLFTVLALAWPFRLWWQLLKTRIGQIPRLKMLLLMLAAFAPFSAALIIVDYARWQAAACHCNFMLLFLLLGDPASDSKLPLPTAKTIHCLEILMLFFLFSGAADWFYFSELCKDAAALCNQILLPLIR